MIHLLLMMQLTVVVGSVDKASFETTPPVIQGVYRSDGRTPLDGMLLGSSSNEVLIVVASTDNVGVGMIQIREQGKLIGSRESFSNKFATKVKIYVGETPINPGVHTWQICVFDFSFNMDCKEAKVTK